MMMDELPRERLGGAIEATCHLEYAFEATREYTKERQAFGGPLSNMQTIRHTMADVKTEVVQTRLFTDHCTELFGQGELDYETASMVKLYTTESINRNVTKLLQLWGGWGYMWEYPIAKTFAGARVKTIYAGTSEIMRELISRSIYSR